MNAIQNMDSTKIQAELDRLLKCKSKENLVKAALFNLIVYTHDPVRTACLKKIIDTILEQFPCRLIFIQADIESSQPRIQVQVTLSSSNGAGISSDQIYIEASGKEIERIPFLIFPHLIPDLPIYLLWGQDPTKDMTILPRIQPLATRIIFDSESTEQLQEFTLAILNLINTTSQEIVDMNWTRISGWRQIIARAFDTKTRLDLITKTSQIKIVYNALKDSSFTRPETQAIYLQAWFASCLGWKYEKIEFEDQKILIHYKALGQDVQIYLIPEIRNDLAAEEIIKWELCAPNNYDCNFSRISTTQVSVKASNQYQCLVPFSFLLPTLQTGRSLMQETFYQKIGEQYPAMLKLISQVKWR